MPPTSKPSVKRKRSTKKKKSKGRKAAADGSECENNSEASDSGDESTDAASDDERTRKFRKMDEESLAAEKGATPKAAVDLNGVFGPKEAVTRDDGVLEEVFPCLVCQ